MKASAARLAVKPRLQTNDDMPRSQQPAAPLSVPTQPHARRASAAPPLSTAPSSPPASPPAFRPFLSLGRRRLHSLQRPADADESADGSIQDSGLEKELRDILEGPRWQLVFADLPRLAARVRILELPGRAAAFPDAATHCDPDANCASASHPFDGNVPGCMSVSPALSAQASRTPHKCPSTSTSTDAHEAAPTATQTATELVSDYMAAAQDQADAANAVAPLDHESSLPCTAAHATSPTVHAATATAATCSDAHGMPIDNASTLILEIARRLEPPHMVASVHDAITCQAQDDATSALSSGDTHAVKHLLTNVLGLQSRTARLLRSINQAVVITATWYLHHNLLGPAGVHVKDVRGTDGWRIHVSFHKDGRTMFITHIRREESLPSSTDAFELEWSLHLGFDGDSWFQGAMLKLHSFEIARDRRGMTDDRVRELMSRFCHGNPVVLEQTLSGRPSMSYHGRSEPHASVPPSNSTNSRQQSLPRRIVALTNTLAGSAVSASASLPVTLGTPVGQTSTNTNQLVSQTNQLTDSTNSRLPSSHTLQSQSRSTSTSSTTLSSDSQTLNPTISKENSESDRPVCPVITLTLPTDHDGDTIRGDVATRSPRHLAKRGMSDPIGLVMTPSPSPQPSQQPVDTNMHDDDRGESGRKPRFRIRSMWGWFKPKQSFAQP